MLGHPSAKPRTVYSVLVLCTYRNVTSKNGERRLGDLGNVIQHVLAQLGRRVAIVVTPRGGAAVSNCRRVSVLAAAQGLFTISLGALSVLGINVPAKNLWGELQMVRAH